jgi:hypothetical protein
MRCWATAADVPARAPATADAAIRVLNLVMNFL